MKIVNNHSIVLLIVDGKNILLPQGETVLSLEGEEATKLVKAIESTFAFKIGKLKVEESKVEAVEVKVEAKAKRN